MSFTWDFVYDTLKSWYFGLLNLFNLMDTPIRQLQSEYLQEILGLNETIAEWVSVPFKTATDVLGIGDITLLGFMIGNALIAYIAYQLVIWILNLVT